MLLDLLFKVRVWNDHYGNAEITIRETTILVQMVNETLTISSIGAFAINFTPKRVLNLYSKRSTSLLHVFDTSIRSLFVAL